MRKLRIGRVIAAVSAAALLIGGIYFLTKDGAAQKISEEKLEPFIPKPVVLQVLDNAVSADETTTVTSVLNEVTTQETTANVIAPNTVSDSIPNEVKTELTDTVKSLRSAYPDAIAWLYIPGTAINYPIMQSDDNDYYLHHAFDGSSLKAGSIFLDHRCENRFMNNLNILYGHNMKNGSMFAGVTYFKDKSYFDSHRYGWLITEDAVNRVDFFALCVTDWHDEIYNGFQQLSDRMPHIREISRIYEDMSVSDSDRLLMLSTCSYEFQNARNILIGKIVKEENI